MAFIRGSTYCVILNIKLFYNFIIIYYCVLSVVTEGKASLIFASPETLTVDSGQWAVNAMKSYRSRICLLALDEIHCLSEWY